MPQSKDTYGQALYDYHRAVFQPPLLLHTSYGGIEDMPVEVFFRSEKDLTTLEESALHLCYGRVLDVGAGAGAHSLILQDRVEEVIAIETSEGACKVMRERGVLNVVNRSVFKYNPQGKFDNLLILMNGTGVFGAFSNFILSLQHLRNLLKPDGQIIIDSSDISYLYEDDEIAAQKGEVAYQYEYKGQYSDWFPWLYVDKVELQKLAEEAGFSSNIVFEDENDQYLAVLKPQL
ncbi:putative methyltransferase [Fulvivirga imtechensis AK7]|uniref:Putative methyltransferase n=1 Tax=Fulvivirga imtechensis AK7 TaxID=1237149 RepID=L8JPJ1_9BACT|nr:class I SAM-dependent methyltransferase [Fulvivirga imtechensis]ELR69434.1 putative methyltransferase [Fulvivirga imtechensis AK7]